MPTLAKLLIISGIALIGFGLLFYLFGKPPHQDSWCGGKIPFLGKLPGDIYIEKKNFTFYFPLATCIMLSLLLTLVFWLFSRR